MTVIRKRRLAKIDEAKDSIFEALCELRRLKNCPFTVIQNQFRALYYLRAIAKKAGK